MNSIAVMKQPKPMPSDESRELKRAIEASGLSKAVIAAHNHVSPGAVSQWADGWRPVPPERAERLAKQLGVDPRKISRRYAATHPPAEGDDAALSVNEEIEAMQYAISALVSSAIHHRPVEAEAVRGALGKVPLRLRERGLVRELLVSLGDLGK